MTAFDLMAEVLADLDAATQKPPKPPAGGEVATLKPLVSLAHSIEATKATQKQASWLDDLSESASCEKFGNDGASRHDPILGGFSGYGGIAEESQCLQESHLGKLGGFGGLFNEELPLPEAWQSGLNRLKGKAVPAGVTPDAWSRLRFAAAAISVGWLGKAAALGWSTIELFGVQAGPAPLAVSGGLLVETVRHEANIIVLTAAEAVLRRRDGSATRYLYRDAIPADLVLIWEVVR